jgi:hypothetical protein
MVAEIECRRNQCKDCHEWFVLGPNESVRTSRLCGECRIERRAVADAETTPLCWFTRDHVHTFYVPSNWNEDELKAFRRDLLFTYGPQVRPKA